MEAGGDGGPATAGQSLASQTGVSGAATPAPADSGRTQASGRKRSGQGPGDGEKQKKRRREDLEWLYVRMNSMDSSSKKLLQDYALQLARDPQTGTFKTGMQRFEKALRVQYSPAEGPASATLVLPLHIRSEAPRKGRRKADDASQQPDYVLQRFYLSEWPPGASLDGRGVYRYSVEPADPSSQAEGAQLPKLIIRDGSCGNKDAYDGKQAHESTSRPQPAPNTASEIAAAGAQEHGTRTTQQPGCEVVQARTVAGNGAAAEAAFCVTGVSAPFQPHQARPLMPQHQHQHSLPPQHQHQQSPPPQHQHQQQQSLPPQYQQQQPPPPPPQHQQQQSQPPHHQHQQLPQQVPTPPQAQQPPAPTPPAGQQQAAAPPQQQGKSGRKARQTRKSTKTKFPHHLAISRSKLPRHDSKFCKAYGQQLVKPTGTRPEDFIVPSGEKKLVRYEKAVRVQHTEDGPIEVVDLHIHSCMDKRATDKNGSNGAALDMRFYINEKDLPAGIFWWGEYKFRIKRLDTDPRLLVIIEDPDVPVASAPPDTGNVSTAASGTSRPPLTESEMPGTRVTDDDQTVGAATEEGGRDGSSSSDDEQQSSSGGGSCQLLRDRRQHQRQQQLPLEELQQDAGQEPVSQQNPQALSEPLRTQQNLPQPLLPQQNLPPLLQPQQNPPVLLQPQHNPPPPLQPQHHPPPPLQPQQNLPQPLQPQHHPPLLQQPQPNPPPPLQPQHNPPPPPQPQHNLPVPLHPQHNPRPPLQPQPQPPQPLQLRQEPPVQPAPLQSLTQPTDGTSKVEPTPGAEAPDDDELVDGVPLEEWLPGALKSVEATAETKRRFWEWTFDAPVQQVMAWCRVNAWRLEQARATPAYMETVAKVFRQLDADLQRLGTEHCPALDQDVIRAVRKLAEAGISQKHLLPILDAVDLQLIRHDEVMQLKTLLASAVRQVEQGQQHPSELWQVQRIVRRAKPGARDA